MGHATDPNWPAEWAVTLRCASTRHGDDERADRGSDGGYRQRQIGCSYGIPQRTSFVDDAATL